MKISTFYTFLACFVLSCMQVNAQSLTKIYSGEKNPAEEGWLELKLDETISPIAGKVSQEVTDGVLKLRSINEADQFTQLGWYKTNLGLSLSKGYTIEIKAKVTDASKYGAFNIQGYDNEGKGFRLGIYKDFLAESTNPLAATNVLKTGLANDDAFHIYRLAVAPNETVTIYRDSEEIGTFPLSVFYFDNIITNGGFEDGGDDFDNAAFFPDFSSKGLLYRTDEPDIDKEAAGYLDINFVKSGNYALIMNSDGKHESTGDDFNQETSERARTREIPVKPDTKYDISISRSRIAAEPWGWRDMGAFYDFQLGTQNGVDDRDDNAFFAGVNDDHWLTHNQTIITPAEDAERVANSLHFEFPSWIRDGDKKTAISTFDDFYIRENLELTIGMEPEGLVGPVFPENYVNLIINGDFEDWTINNDGSEYDWALSDPEDADNNRPAKFNELWNAPVRIQRTDKPDDRLDGQWAHSGTSSLRFSSLDNRHWEDTFVNDNGDPEYVPHENRTLAFSKELEADKLYRFNFWHRNPHWGESAWLKVKIGDDIIWGNRCGGDNNVWANADITFATTSTNKTLYLYLDEYCCGWYNIYFDDLVLYEIETLEDPLLAGKTNLIYNGDFEDGEMGNDGEPCFWAWASDHSGDDDNYPVAWNDMWGTYVRLQDKQKVHDTGLNWAHSGEKSLRMSFLNDKGRAEEVGMPEAYRVNMNFKKELEPNKTYTFVFWIKSANYPDRGDLMIANGETLLWKDQLSTKHISWSRQSVTFSTTEKNHTLRMFTEWDGWFNFYLDDLFLYEEDTYIPFGGGDSYLFFGKSTGTEATNVDIEYVAINNTGAFAPTGIKNPDVKFANTTVWSDVGRLSFKALNPASVKVYTVAGVQLVQLNVEKEATISLPQGIYIVKSVSSNGVIETVKAIVK